MMRACLVMMVALSTSAISVLSSGCTALYFFNASEENLPCGPDDANGSPRCKDGFVCVKTDDEIDRCVKEAFKEQGEECLDPLECKAEGSACADAYAVLCPAGTSDISCALVDTANTGLRCRTPCDRGSDCADDEHCFLFGDEPGFCQKGTCTTDNDCVAGLQQGRCVSERGNGRNGLCQLSCDPLDCNTPGRVCACAADQNCTQPADESDASAAAVCDQIGVIAAPLTCDVLNPCESGATCTELDGADVFVCAQWCRVAGGAPACDTGRCNAVPGDPELGICQ